MTHTEYVAAYRVAEKKAVDAGFKREKGKGYWKAVHAFCDANGIKLPTTRKAKAEPKVKVKVAAPKAESPKDRKNRLERERRARAKAAKDLGGDGDPK